MDEPRKDSAGKDLAGARLCPQCGAAFICGLAASSAAESASSEDLHCWCFDLPAVMPVRADTACLCPACLLKAIRQVQEIKQ